MSPGRFASNASSGCDPTKKPALLDRVGRITRLLANIGERKTAHGGRLVPHLSLLEARNLILNLQLLNLKPVNLQIVRARPGDLVLNLTFENPMLLR